MSILRNHWVIVATIAGAIAAPLLVVLLMLAIESAETAKYPGGITIPFGPGITIPALGNLSITGYAVWFMLALIGAVAAGVVASLVVLVVTKMKQLS